MLVRATLTLHLLCFGVGIPRNNMPSVIIHVLYLIGTGVKERMKNCRSGCEATRHIRYFIGTGVKERMKINMAVQPMILRLRSKGI